MNDLSGNSVFDIPYVIYNLLALNMCIYNLHMCINYTICDSLSNKIVLNVLKFVCNYFILHVRILSGNSGVTLIFYATLFLQNSLITLVRIPSL
jgi:hypothetical protein